MFDISPDRGWKKLGGVEPKYIETHGCPEFGQKRHHQDNKVNSRDVL